MVIIILLILGICLGSFINAFVWRLHEQEELAEQKGIKGQLSRIKAKLKHEDLSITKGRSMCTHCHHALAAKDLVPIASYFSLKGKCRYCGKPIEDTPLPEILTPLLFVVSYLFWPHGFSTEGIFLFVLWLAFLVGFVILVLYDLRWYILPDKVVFPLAALAAFQVLIVSVVFGGGFGTLFGAVLGVAVGAGIFYALFQVSKGTWIGGGDVKLGIVFGLLAGGAGQAFLVIFIASLLGTLLAVPLMALGKADRSSHLPFGPFLLLATFIVVLFGQRIINWYTGLIAV